MRHIINNLIENYLWQSCIAIIIIIAALFFIINYFSSSKKTQRKDAKKRQLREKELLRQKLQEQKLRNQNELEKQQDTVNGSKTKTQKMQTQGTDSNYRVNSKINSLIDRLLNLLPTLNYKYKKIESAIDVLKVIKENNDSPLLVVVLGEFSSGKSTFINALLKEQRLAMKIRPSTATITQLQYGREPELYVHYNDGKVERSEMNKLNDFTVENFIKTDNLLDKIYFVRLQLDNKILENIDIADTPGFNSSIERHTEITSKFIAHADVVIWLFDANQMLKGTEIAVLEKYCRNFKPIAIINKTDSLGLQNNNEVLKELDGQINKIAGLVEKVFPVSSKNALNDKDGEYKLSGMQDIVDYFYTDIIPNGGKTKERMTKVKFAQIAVEIDAVRKEIETKLQGYQKEIDTFEKQKLKYDETVNLWNKSIGNWNEDCGPEKTWIWMVKNIKRYFMVDDIPNELKTDSNIFIKENLMLKNSIKKIEKWSDAIEKERINFNQLYEDIEVLKEKYYEKIAMPIIDNIWRFFSGEEFSLEKININKQVNLWSEWSERFNSDIDEYNKFLIRTNEKIDELNRQLNNFL
ncbi:dynamin family protein, partial [Candidatus Neomarinimicrobiota bacterium]